MERHGSESYFVIGEGLLGEARGGRQLAAASAPAGIPRAMVGAQAHQARLTKAATRALTVTTRGTRRLVFRLRVA